MWYRSGVEIWGGMYRDGFTYRITDRLRNKKIVAAVLRNPCRWITYQSVRSESAVNFLFYWSIIVKPGITYEYLFYLWGQTRASCSQVVTLSGICDLQARIMHIVHSGSTKHIIYEHTHARKIRLQILYKNKNQKIQASISNLRLSWFSEMVIYYGLSDLFYSLYRMVISPRQVEIFCLFSFFSSNFFFRQTLFARGN